MRDYSFKGKKILDIGAGSGKYSVLFPSSKYFSYDIIPFDTVLTVIPDIRFDFVFCNFILEHAADPYEILDSASKVLLPNGVLVISLPSLSLLEILGIRILKRKISLPFFHLRTFSFFPTKGCMSFREITTFLERNNFKSLTIKGIYSDFKSGKIICRIPPLNYFGTQTVITAVKYEEN